MTSSNSVLGLPELSWDHLRRLTGPFGLYEHAFRDMPRLGHGYTTDDNGRALVVAARAGADRRDLRPYLEFVLAGRTENGWHNRMSVTGRWTDRLGPDDAMGRAVWGLAEVVSAGDRDERVLTALRHGLRMTSPHLRSNAYLLLAAACAHRAGLAEAEPSLRAGLARIPHAPAGAWAWPEPRLTYDNGRIPEALIRAGAALDAAAVVDRGLAMLAWLVGIESGEGHFSFTPVGGRGPGERGPAFDQQPIEAWAMVDACRAAGEADPSGPWADLARQAGEWCLGRNDVGVELYDAETGAGFDGLKPEGVNLNRGAESTLSVLGSLWALHDAAAQAGR
ncbi:MAG TPA: glycosyltransferase [Acidimicrobiia bacterium]|jgi:hypothetical protein|nr:glycosyltransferase [Acidimicrobiia bacterium]